MRTLLIVLCDIVLVVMAINSVVTIVLARRYHASGVWRRGDRDPGRPHVAVIVPAFNEEPTIGACITSLFAQEYPNLSIVVVDDGSTDATSDAARSAISRSPSLLPVDVVRKRNGGKAAALNYGVMMTEAEIIICVDADSVLEPSAITQIVESFADAAVGAVGGVVKIANDRTLLGRQQGLEYISTLMISRSAFARIGALQVMSGALSAFRREAVDRVGGYSRKTLTEDFDITLDVQRIGHRAVLNPEAVAYTEGPLTYRDLYKQRYRWSYGSLQVLHKYGDYLFTKRAGALSRWGLPYMVILPWVDVFVSMMFFVIVPASIMNGSFDIFLAFLTFMLLVTSAGNIYALHLAGEPRRRALYGIPMLFWYSHVGAWATLRAGIGYRRRRAAEWEKLERSGEDLDRGSK